MDSAVTFSDMDFDACMESVSDSTPMLPETPLNLTKKRSYSNEYPLTKPTITKHFILAKNPAASLRIGVNGVSPEARLTQEGNQTCFVLNFQELVKLAEWDFCVNTTADLGYDDTYGGICVCEAIRNSDGLLLLQRRLIPNRQPADEWEKRLCIRKEFTLTGHATGELVKNIRAALTAAQMLEANVHVFAHMHAIIVRKLLALQSEMCSTQPIESVFEELYRVMREYTAPSFFVRQFLDLNLTTDLSICDVYDVCAAHIVHLRELAVFAATNTDMMAVDPDEK